MARPDRSRPHRGCVAPRRSRPGAGLPRAAARSHRPRGARDYPALLLDRTDRPGLVVQRAELLRYLRRLGQDVASFPGCPDRYAAGLQGDWQGAAAGRRRRGDPYEEALELAESAEVEPTLAALAILDQLGAEPAAALVRRRLRELGLTRLPSKQLPSTRANPAGLTPRQLEILRLLA